ncbi:unnamed protein product [Closterium sp. NIES-54]
MALRPSSVPQRVPLPSPPASFLPDVPDPESDLACAASPAVTRLLATVVTDPDFESTAAFALTTRLVEFAASSRLDYVASLVSESEPVCPPSVGGEPALGNDVHEDMQFELECLTATLPRFASMLLFPEGDPDALDIPTLCSYAEAITVDGMWIFRVKRPPGSPPAFKARYVARGFRQRQGVDFFQTFSPTPKMTTLWVLLHVAAQCDYELHSLDFSTAFLQCSLHEEIWLRRPPGFTGPFPAGTQWSLRRPVYGLRRALRGWHNTLRTTLADLGFASSSADPSLFLRTDTSLPTFYVLVYIDDLVFATGDTEALALVKAELQERHTCTDLGELHSYLGLQITRDRARRTITLTQSHMVHQVHQRFGFQFSSPQPTPLPTGHSLSAPPSDDSVEPSGPYPELVGCLMYMMTCTRPDLKYPLSLLARYVAPGRHRKVHWDAAKKVLRYVCSSTSGMGLVLGGQGSVVLTGHSDASWADNQVTLRSSQGYTFILGSGSFSWRSTRSSSVLGSSCEAEIYAGAMAAQKLRWLTYLLTDLGEWPRSPPVLYVDNKTMLAMAQVITHCLHAARAACIACALPCAAGKRPACAASLPPAPYQRRSCAALAACGGFAATPQLLLPPLPCSSAAAAPAPVTAATALLVQLQPLLLPLQPFLLMLLSAAAAGECAATPSLPAAAPELLLLCAATAVTYAAPPAARAAPTTAAASGLAAAPELLSLPTLSRTLPRAAAAITSAAATAACTAAAAKRAAVTAACSAAAATAACCAAAAK